ncbi:heme ABC transporter ATP-binding protein/permease CydC [Shewanella sp.]|uniref:heme ABC transporter ATP-binding protein/permease CydC n=1 Tax=Shewanella sp. TaxID=50422 RepID=UPI0040546A51
MKDLLPYLRLFKQHLLMMSVGFTLTLISLLAAMGLLALSGWFISASAVAGLTAASAAAFNFFTPAAGVRFFSILRTVSRYGERMATHQATFSLLADLRVWVWKRLLPLSSKELSTIRQGDLLNRLIADIDTLDHLYLRLITPMFAALVMILSLYFFVAWFNLGIALVLVVFLLTTWLVLPWFFYHLGSKAGTALPQTKQAVRVQLIDILQGQAELSLFEANNRYLQGFYQAEARLYTNQESLAKVAGLSQGVIILCHGFAVISVLLMAGIAMDAAINPSHSVSGVSQLEFITREPITGAVLALLVFTAMACIETLQPISLAFNQLATSIASAKRLNTLVNQTPSIQFAESALDSSASTAALTTIKGVDKAPPSLSLTGINFGYTQTQPLFQQLELIIPKGEKVALLGPTGCGKSSLLSLISREYLPDSGDIQINGQQITALPEDHLRSSMSIVSQRVDIFSASLRDNLSIAINAESLNDKDIDARIIQTLQHVGLEYLANTTQGLSLWLGEGGRTLSGGERRRIGIARVLLHDAQLLLLDEPTEGLDSKTEMEILNLLFEFAKDKSLLMISHKLTGMDRMDKIYRLQAGKAVQLNIETVPKK